LKQIVESNKTLLVDGPASVRLESGRAEVFGFQVKISSRIVVREGKRLPFHVLERAFFDVSLGANSSLHEADGTTVLVSWNNLVEAVLAFQKRPVTVVVVGQADSGKSSICTYMTNKLVERKCRVTILDGDLGQSDIGPSATMSYAQTSKPITELRDLKLDNAFFVGVTSPVSAFAKTIEGLSVLKAEILQGHVDYVLVNTDGWVKGDIAVRHKKTLIENLKPEVVVGVQLQDELLTLIANLDNTQTIVIESPSELSSRTAEKRKDIREMTYARYLRGAKLQCYPISQLIVEPKNAISTIQEPEKGLLVGLYGRGGKFLCIGLLRQINRSRRLLKIQTSVLAKPTRIVVGRVLLNKKLQEIQV
jgi:polynucleotide 5'-hydroxyl-kinase GRC3/NOL9